MCAWKIEGDYAETCNCNLLCPCIATNMAATPTETDCKAAANRADAVDDDPHQ